MPCMYSAFILRMNWNLSTSVSLSIPPTNGCCSVQKNVLVSCLVSITCVYVWMHCSFYCLCNAVVTVLTLALMYVLFNHKALLARFFAGGSAIETQYIIIMKWTKSYDIVSVLLYFYLAMFQLNLVMLHILVVPCYRIHTAYPSGHVSLTKAT